MENSRFGNGRTFAAIAENAYPEIVNEYSKGNNIFWNLFFTRLRIISAALFLHQEQATSGLIFVSNAARLELSLNYRLAPGKASRP